MLEQIEVQPEWVYYGFFAIVILFVIRAVIKKAAEKALLVALFVFLGGLPTTTILLRILDEFGVLK